MQWDNYAFLPAPAVHFPMEVINGNQLEGTYRGTIEGSGVGLLPGKINQAIAIRSNSYIQYGQRQHECYHNPDMCDTGLTYAMWLRLAPSQPATDTIVLNTGAAKAGPNGICVRYKVGVSLLIIKINSGLTVNFNVPIVESGVWFHLVFTWREQGQIHAYVNGCPADYDVFVTPRTASIGNPHDFTIGRHPDLAGNLKSTVMRIDELRIWYQRFESDQVWALYGET